MLRVVIFFFLLTYLPVNSQSENISIGKIKGIELLHELDNCTMIYQNSKGKSEYLSFSFSDADNSLGVPVYSYTNIPSFSLSSPFTGGGGPNMHSTYNGFQTNFIGTTNTQNSRSRRLEKIY